MHATLSIVLICCVVSLAHSSSTVFLHPRGSDANSGTTKSQPLRTIQSAVSLLSSTPGPKEIILLDGHYEGFDLSWNSPDVLTIRAENKGKAVFNGGIFIPASQFVIEGSFAFTKLPISNPGEFFHNGLGICEHNLTEVFADGQPLHRARYPNVQSDGLFGWLNVQNPNGAQSFTSQIGPHASNWIRESDPWVHGYWQQDWADSYTKVTSIQVLPNGTALFNVSDNISAHPKARFYVTNLKSELDSTNEYYIDSTTLQLSLFAPNGHFPFPNGVWITDKNPWVIDLSNSKNVVLEGATVVYGRGGGINCQKCENVQILNANVSMHSREGINVNGKSNKISSSTVSYSGCTAITMTGGSKLDLIPFNNSVINNDIFNYARLIRTYNPGIKWGGVGSTYINNRISNAPHNGILGGGNTFDGCNNLFLNNVVSNVAYETCDTGAFYTCGQRGQAFICRGNRLISNTFVGIRTRQPTPLGYPSVQAVYLDDESSGWTVFNNTFIDCQKAVFVGGGRDNQVTGNVCNKVDVCLHLDNRGMNWQKDACLNQDVPTSKTVNPTIPPWSVQFPEVAMIPEYHPCVPVNNSFEKNTYCNGELSDFTTAQASEWFSTLANNQLC